jgi:hypothetical protein
MLSADFVSRYALGGVVWRVGKLHAADWDEVWLVLGLRCAHLGL